MSLAAADFDEDGTPDLVVGSSEEERGRLRVYRGNPDVVYLNAPEARQRRVRGESSEAPFLEVLAEADAEIPAAWLAAGDFDADGHVDVAATAPGARFLLWFRGDGRGALGSPRRVTLDGEATALASGEVNRRDGLQDVAVGVSGAKGSRVLLFQSARGAFEAPPEALALPAPATDLAIGLLEEDPFGDLVVATGSEVVILRGRNRPFGAPKNEPDRFEIGSSAAAVEVGDFQGDQGLEVAALGEDGVLRVISLSGEKKAGARRAVQLFEGTGNGPQPLLLAARVSSLPKDDLVVLGSDGTTAAVFNLDADAAGSDHLATLDASPRAHLLELAALPRSVVAALPMRLDPDALADLVLLEEAASSPSVLVTKAFASVLAATYTVNSTLDTTDSNTGDGLCDDGAGRCTLRAAIQQANASPGADTIVFAIPGGGIPTIVVGTSFPILTEAATIDATTQAAGRVAIDGNSQSNHYIFRLSGGNTVVRGFVLIRCNRTFTITANGGNLIEGNWIGLATDGTTLQASTYRIDVASANNTIGGTVAAARNVVAAADYGVYLGAGPNVVQGNYLGTDATGTADRGNVNDGIRISSGNNNTIGGTTAGSGNVISGNGDYGVYLATTGNLIQGNFIGTNASGTSAIANDDFGIRIADFDNTIGGTTAAARNVVSGNAFEGIYAYSRAVIQGNHIGTNLAGSSAIPNGGNGVEINTYDDVLVGGTTPGARNVISGNGQDGVALLFSPGFSSPNNNRIEGNFIGTDVTGTAPLANLRDGVVISFNDGCNTIGGTAAGAGNLISGNGRYGVLLSSLSVGCGQPNRVFGNRIGTNVFGTGALANASSGIRWSGSTAGTLIGGSSAGESNRIAFNSGDGIASTSSVLVFSGVNEIFDNGGLGIDRLDDGVTANSAGASSNFPVITTADRVGAVTNVSGTLSAAGPAGLVYTIHFFANDACDPSGYGEGKTYAGSTTVTVDAAGNGNFATALSPAVPGGRQLTAYTVAPASQSSRVSEFSACRLVTGDPTPPPTDPLSLLAVVPPQGGDTAHVTVRITGQGIQPGAAAKLRRSGFPDILAVRNDIDPSGGSVSATFPLANQARGFWDVVVTNPDTQTAALPGAFEIVAARGPEVWTQLLGYRTIRPSRKATFHLVYGNRGDVDAHGVPLWIGGIPADATVELVSQPSIAPFIGQAPPPQWDATTHVITLQSGEKLIPLLVPVIPPNVTRVISFTVTVPTERQFTLRVGYSPPWFGSPLIDDMTKCLLEIIKLITPLIPGADCFMSLIDLYGASYSQAVNPSGDNFYSMLQNLAQVAWECVSEVFPLGAAIDLIKDLIDLIWQARTALEACNPIFGEDHRIGVVSARDPNAKIGPEGAGANRYVDPNDPVAYGVFFENLETATAPAQEVVVTDQLDPNAFDLASFEFGPVVVADRRIPAPIPGVSTFTADLDLRPQVDAIVRVTGQINRATGLLTWRFLSIDPVTGLEEQDPFDGFLPPNTNPPRGEGAAFFMVRAKTALATGDTFSNFASIVFDTNPAIATPNWTNTVDRTPPVSQVISALQFPCANFQVHWTGSDAGAGISEYTLYASENGGPFQSIARTAMTFHTFAGHAGSTYAFYTVARDAVGNVEAAPASADVSAVAAAGGQCFYTVTPCRVVDTRWIAGQNGGPALLPAGERSFEIAGRCGIPESARAISANVTITQPADFGFLALYPSGTPLPLVSNINYRPGQTRANNAVVPLGTDGKIAVACGQAAGTVHFIVDVNGYFQ